jgi:peptidyl-dipeptidase A
MVRIGERFFTSLGFEPLPKTFWDRSLFVKPRDREVVCHASAWDIDSVDDLRIKMCIDVTAEDFTTIHHELGHNFYQRAYNTLPMILRDSANDGFHEAVGDTLALSVTPEYLVKLGLVAKAPDASADTGLLLHAALETPGVPSIRSARGSMALAGLCRADSAGRLQQGMVGSEAAVSGSRAPGATR